MEKKEETQTKLAEEFSELDIKVKVNRFDSLASVDETDAIKIGKHHLFASHAQQAQKHEEFVEEIVKPSPDADITAEETIMKNMVTIDSSDVYESSFPKRGLCLLIENDMFSTNLGLSKRKGSSIDRMLMINVFTKLEFEVRVLQNLSSKDIEKALEKASLEDHSKREMFAVVILSHGNEGILYGYDSAYPAHKIWEPFTADRCSSLIGKPKLFFIQVRKTLHVIRLPWVL